MDSAMGRMAGAWTDIGDKHEVIFADQRFSAGRGERHQRDQRRRRTLRPGTLPANTRASADQADCEYGITNATRECSVLHEFTQDYIRTLDESQKRTAFCCERSTKMRLAHMVREALITTTDPRAAAATKMT